MPWLPAPWWRLGPSSAALACEAGPQEGQEPGGPEIGGALRVLVAGCRLLTDSLMPVLSGYRGLAAFETADCGILPERLDAHVEEPHGGIPGDLSGRPGAVDAIVLPPTPRSLDGAPVPVVRIELALPCVLDLLREEASPAGVTVLLLPVEMVPRVLVAALAEHAPGVPLMTYLGVDQLHGQLGLLARLRPRRVVADPAGAALAERAGLPARSIYAGSGRCLAVHAIERALARASLARLGGLAHHGAGQTGAEGLPFGLPPSGAASRPAESPTRGVVALRTTRRFVLVPAERITYISSRGGLVTAYTDAGTFWSDRTLGEVEARLDPRRFVRLDASRVVNLSHVVELVPWTHQRYKLRLDDSAQTELVLSRDVGRRLRAVLGW